MVDIRTRRGKTVKDLTGSVAADDFSTAKSFPLSSLNPEQINALKGVNLQQVLEDKNTGLIKLLLRDDERGIEPTIIEGSLEDIKNAGLVPPSQDSGLPIIEQGAGPTDDTGFVPGNQTIDSVPRFDSQIDLNANAQAAATPQQILTSSLQNGDFEQAQKALDAINSLAGSGSKFKKDLTPEALLADRIRGLSERRQGRLPSNQLTNSGAFAGEKRSPFAIEQGLSDKEFNQQLKAFSAARNIRADKSKDKRASSADRRANKADKRADKALKLRVSQVITSSATARLNLKKLKAQIRLIDLKTPDRQSATFDRIVKPLVDRRDELLKLASLGLDSGEQTKVDKELLETSDAIQKVRTQIFTE
jgi:hypothetical protein